MERLNGRTIIRNDSGEFLQLIQDVGFVNAEVRRVAENILQVELNENQDVLDPVSIEGVVCRRHFIRELQNLKNKLDQNPSEVTASSLELILRTNQLIATRLLGLNIEPNEVELELLARGIELEIEVSDILSSRRDINFLWRLAREGSYQENLKVILNTISLLDREVQRVRGKDILLFLGPTGAGKTTTLLYLSGVNMVRMNTEDMELMDAFDETVITTNDPSHPRRDLIGHNPLNSHTFFPYIHDQRLTLPNGDHIELVDFPGFLDSSGWQTTIALDIALKRLMDNARSTRILVVLDKRSFQTAGANVVARTIEKLDQFYPQREEHTVLGITHTDNISRALGTSIERRCGDRVSYCSINPIESESRNTLINLINSKDPILTSQSCVISPNDIVAFRTLIQSESTIESIVTSAISMHRTPAEGMQENIQIEELRDHLNSLTRLSEWLSDGSKPSLLVEIDPVFRQLADLEDPALMLEVLDLERLVALEIFKAGIWNFNNQWEVLRNGYETRELQINQGDWHRINQRLTQIENRINPYLELRFIDREACVPQNFWIELYNFVNNPRVIINIIGIVGNLNQRQQVQIQEVIFHITELVRNYFDAGIGEESAACQLTLSTLNVAEQLIEASFRRGTMIDQFCENLRRTGEG